jgi:hypothetical protein
MIAEDIKGKTNFLFSLDVSEILLENTLNKEFQATIENISH